MGKIKHRSRLNASEIQPNEQLLNELIKYSFKYLQVSKKYDYRKCDSHYFQALFDRLRDISNLKLKELPSKSKTLKYHEIKWGDTTEEGFSSINPEIWAGSSYQFSLSKNELGRVHGFIIETVFYIVWLDVDHNLYK